MKLYSFTILRNLPIFHFLKYFKMEKSISSASNNLVQVCSNEVKVSHVLNLSLHKFDSEKSSSNANLAMESKVLQERKSNINDEKDRNSILSAILFEAFGESPFSDNEKISEGCASAESMLAGSNKRKRSDKCSSNVNSDQASQKVSSTRPFTVSIEGNIGSGKSTFLKHFAAMPKVATYQEPLGKWTDVGGHNLLGKLYEDSQRWSFLFQSYVQLTRLQIHLQQDKNASVKLIERSLQNNRYCFVESGHDSGDLHSSEYAVLCEYFDTFNENLDLGVDLIVYLRSSPEVVHQRMQQRGRAEEAGVPLTYLQKLHDYYERWLMEGKPCSPPAPVLVIDANSDLLSITRCINLHQRFILGQEVYEGTMKDPQSEQENTSPFNENLKNDMKQKRNTETVTGTHLSRTK